MVKFRDLPPPPLGKRGWPWTEDEQVPAKRIADGEQLPRVSVVTPSFNQVRFLEQTIRSVLLQSYPNLEYIVIDGGSNDGSIEMLQKYSPWIDYWSSEVDSGQSEAINKGFRRATGSVVAWLNSDDWYLPGAVYDQVAELGRWPDASLVYGDCVMADADGSPVDVWRTRGGSLNDLLMVGNMVPQPTVFMRASALELAGGIDPSLNYAMDYELWLRLARMGSLRHRPVKVACFRLHDESKTVSQGIRFAQEKLSLLDQWCLPAGVLSASECREAYRRTHLWAATEALLGCDQNAAREHFSQALADGVWPFGGLESAADQVAFGTGVDGRKIAMAGRDARLAKQALSSIGPRRMGYRLWRRAMARAHMAQLYAKLGPMAERMEVRRHVMCAIWYQPSLILNQGIAVTLMRNLV